jgi:AbrB family looped-hinge helix DNA binding protein
MRHAMNVTIPIDRAGRLVIPKAFRARLQLRAGDRLEVELAPDGIILRPQRATRAGLAPHGSRMIWDAPDAVLSQEDVEAALSRGREERDQRAGGEGP